jgi:hypothetical protein
MMTKCIECNEKRGIYRNKLSMNICTKCFILPKYILITKTKSKQIYKMNDDDLIGLYEIHGTCPYGEATYYKKEEIIAYACKKYTTTPDELDIVLHNIQNQKNIMKQRTTRTAITKTRDKRKLKLMQCLNQAGLILRNDSVLCQQYINGDSKYELDYIVTRMKQMKFLFEYCHMEECKNIAYEEYVDDLDGGYYPDCSVFDRAEDIALTKYSGGRYPTKFPWDK